MNEVDPMEGRMIIECDTCAMQETDACEDCIVTVLLAGMDDAPGHGVVELDDQETDALSHLADAGLVAPLRLVPYQGDRGAVAG